MEIALQDIQLIEDIAEILATLKPDQILLVAIDGVDGVGKTTFAYNLAKALAATCNRCIIQASVDGFHNARQIRYARGKSSPEGFYRDSYDYTALRTYLLDPLKSNGSRLYRTSVFNYRDDSPAPIEERIAVEGSILLLDGIFLHRPELRDFWDFSIFLDAPFEITVPRMAVRDDASSDPWASSNRRYVEGQQIYLREVQPSEHASIAIDHSDFNQPRIVKPPKLSHLRIGA